MKGAIVLSIAVRLASAVPGMLVAGPLFADPGDLCARVGNDDQLRVYDPSLRQDFVRAFKRLNPKAKGTLADPVLRAQAVYRCMAHRLVACFRSADLPCAKLDAARTSPGATAFCHNNPATGDVPLSASGHQFAYRFRCEGGRAIVAGQAWTIDARGFAAEQWAPLELD